MPQHSDARKQQARINGAKSKGPKTASGRARSSAASTKHGLFAAHGSLLATENSAAYEMVRLDVIAQWTPANSHDLLLVEELVDCTWLISRLRFAATIDIDQRIRRIRSEAAQPVRLAEAAAKAEIDASADGGPQIRLERRIRALIANRSRIMADLRHARQVSNPSGLTQNSLKINHIPFPTNPENPQHGPQNPETAQQNPETPGEKR